MTISPPRPAPPTGQPFPPPPTPDASRRERRTRRLLSLLAIIVVGLFVIPFLYSQVLFPICHPTIPGVDVTFGSPVASRSPDGKTYYDNISFMLSSSTYVVPGCGLSDPSKTETISTSNFSPAVANGSQEFPSARAECSPPENFSNCNATSQGWYAALFNQSAGVQSSFPTTAGEWGSGWTAAVVPGTETEHLSFVSPTPFHGQGFTLDFIGIGLIFEGYAQL